MKFLAFDLGATSGRAIIGTVENDKLTSEEVYRFPNAVKEIDGKYYEIKCSIGIAWSDNNDISYARYFDEADEQLYKAKKAGKCRICHKKIN